jgi:MFS family permease
MTSRFGGDPGSRWFRQLLVGFTAIHAATSLMIPMASYRGLQLGMAPASLGLLPTAFSVLPLIVSLRVGRMVDRRGGRAFMLGGTLVMIFAGLGLVAATSVALLLVAVGLLGAGHMTAVVAAQGSVAQGSDERTYDQRFSALGFAAALGQLVGPGLAGLVAGEGSASEVSAALLVGAGLSTIATLAIVIFRPARRAARPADEPATASSPMSPAPSAPSLAAILRTPGVLGAIVVSTCVLLAIDILITYLPALGEERGWPASLVGAFLALRGASSMSMRFALGPLATRFGRFRLLFVAMAMAAGALIAVPLVDSVPVFVLLMVAMGAGLGTGQPLTMAWVASIALPETRATALSIRLVGNRLGQLVVPAAAGVMAAFAGAGGVLAAGGLLVALGLVGLPRPSRARVAARA